MAEVMNAYLAHVKSFFLDIRVGDPWKKVGRSGRMPFAIKWSPNFGNRLWAIAGITALAAIGGFSQGFSSGIIIVLGGLAVAAATFIYEWRSPTFVAEFPQAQYLEAGNILCIAKPAEEPGRHIATLPANFILEVFIHHGRDLVLCAMADGTVSSLYREEIAGVPRPHDRFQSIRGSGYGRVMPPTVSPSSLDIVAVIWDGANSDAKICSALSWTSEATKAALNVALQERMLTEDTQGWPKRQVIGWLLTEAANVVLAADRRRHGIEIFDNAKEQKVPEINNNYGNVFQNSPGAAGVVGSGQASSSGLPSGQIVDLLRAVISNREHIEACTDPENEDAVVEAIDSMQRELDSTEPDEGKLKRATRVCAQFADALVRELAGHAAWDAVRDWAGI